MPIVLLMCLGMQQGQLPGPDHCGVCEGTTLCTTSWVPSSPIWSQYIYICYLRTAHTLFITVQYSRIECDWFREYNLNLMNSVKLESHSHNHLLFTVSSLTPQTIHIHVHMNILTQILFMLHKLWFIKLGRTLSRNKDGSGQLCFKFQCSMGNENIG